MTIGVNGRSRSTSQTVLSLEVEASKADFIQINQSVSEEICRVSPIPIGEASEKLKQTGAVSNEFNFHQMKIMKRKCGSLDWSALKTIIFSGRVSIR